MWWKSAVSRSFFLSPAAFRTRSSDWDMRARLCVRCMYCCSAFPLVPALGSIASATGDPALFGDFTATMAESDFSCPFIIGYGSSPSRGGPVRLEAARSGKRSPRFRRVPFIRDVAQDPGRATEPRIAAPHMLPSTDENVSAPAILNIIVAHSHTPNNRCVRFAVVVTSHDATLTIGRALPLTRAGLAPAGTRQLGLAHLTLFVAPHFAPPQGGRRCYGVGGEMCTIGAA